MIKEQEGIEEKLNLIYENEENENNNNLDSN